MARFGRTITLPIIVGRAPAAVVTGPQTYTKSGYGVAGGLIGSGPSEWAKVKSGYATVGCTEAGTRAVEHTRSGYGIAGLTEAGARTGEHYRTGAGIAGLVGAGPSATIEGDSGFATVGGIGAGARARELNRTG